MAGIKIKCCTRLFFMVLFAQALFGCVSTEALYAEYDAADCILVASNDAVVLHERNTDTELPWEPAIYFGYDSSILSSEEIERLNVSMRVLKEFPILGLSLQGFTDSLGSVVYNQRLAEKRIAAVHYYLRKQGIAEDRIYLQPIGKALAQLDVDDANTHAINRRVELMLLDATGRPMTVQYAIDR